jgi:hypothetical protein
MRTKPLVITVNRAEREQVKLAASLKLMSVREYVRRAINRSLVRDGVDAVLLRELEDR